MPNRLKKNFVFFFFAVVGICCAAAITITLSPSLISARHGGIAHSNCLSLWIICCQRANAHCTQLNEIIALNARLTYSLGLPGAHCGFRKPPHLTIDNRNTKENECNFRRTVFNLYSNVQYCPILILCYWVDAVCWRSYGCVCVCVLKLFWSIYTVESWRILQQRENHTTDENTTVACVHTHHTHSALHDSAFIQKYDDETWK